VARFRGGGAKCPQKNILRNSALLGWHFFASGCFFSVPIGSRVWAVRLTKNRNKLKVARPAHVPHHVETLPLIGSEPNLAGLVDFNFSTRADTNADTVVVAIEIARRPSYGEIRMKVTQPVESVVDQSSEITIEQTRIVCNPLRVLLKITRFRESEFTFFN